MPQDLQAILKEAMVNFGNANKEIYEKEKDAILNMQKELGYEVVTLSDADVAKMKKISIEKIWPNEAKKDKELGKAYQSIRKYLKIQ